MKSKNIDIHETIPYTYMKKILLFLVKYLNLQKLGSGVTRKVYKYNKSLVIKLPINHDGIECNILEYISYKNNPNKKAKCKLVFIKGVPCIVMELVKDVWNKKNRVDFDNTYDSCPEWAKNLNDGPQVGYNRKGDLVCYDYAYNNTDRFKNTKQYNRLIKKSWTSMAKNFPDIFKFKPIF